MKNILILTLATIFLIQANAQNWVEVRKAVAPDRWSNDRFGTSVSISCDFAIVGAHFEDEDASEGNNMSAAGSAYIFERDSSDTWKLVQKIVASDRAPNDNFGDRVSISGNYAIVGAGGEDEDATGSNSMNNAGSAYVFERDGSGNWMQVQKIVASDRAVDDRFGWSVSISGDYAIVGALLEDEDASGGNTLILAGSAYLFKRGGSGTWDQVQKIVAADRAMGDQFGTVSISGDYVIIGAGGEDHNATGADSMWDAGSAYVFERDGSGIWNQVQKIVASDRGPRDKFGTVSISGDYAIVGAASDDENATGGDSITNAGSAYLFERDSSGNWMEVQKVVASDRGFDNIFGSAVSISGNNAIVGSREDDEDAAGGNTLNIAGAAYMFERDGSGNWMQVQKIVASDRAMGDQFGGSVSINDNYVIVGALQEMNAAGSAYLFEVPCLINTPITQSGFTLTANTSCATYQWLDCDNNMAPITGETNQSFTATVNGNYAVEITKKGCIDTSACYLLTSGIMENDFGDELIVYPNPTPGKFNIDLGETYHDVSVIVSNLLGQIISSQHFGTTQQMSIDVSKPAGFYLIEIQTGEGKSATLKVLKE